MRRRLTGAASALLFALVLVGVAAAVADNTVVDDNRNVRANKLDIEQARAGHNADQLQHTIITYRPWRTGMLESTRARPRAACVYIWKAGRNINGRQDYEICARVRKNKLRAYVWKARPKRKLKGRVDVKRFDLNSITFNFTPALIDSPKLYRWQAVTGFTGKGCPKDPPYQFGCDDSAPTRGAVPYDLTKPEPETPTS
jgi:hypothetical protein